MGGLMDKPKGLEKIEKIFEQSILVKKQCLKQGLDSIFNIGKIAATSVLRGNKIMLCGNGGSAADAQHLAAEMLIRLHPNNNREGVPAIALAQDSSTITACGNDFGFDKLYQRMVLSLGNEGDCLIAITTSGNSKNIILAMQAAKKRGIKVLGFLGCGGGDAIHFCDEAFVVPSDDTGRIQEAHITAGHALMDYIEVNLIENDHLHLH
jgi:D-sedoheptulose 7-phosphate isomerase